MHKKLVLIRTWVLLNLKADQNRYSCRTLHRHATICYNANHSAVLICRQIHALWDFLVVLNQLLFDYCLFLIFGERRLQKTANRRNFLKKVRFGFEKLSFLATQPVNNDLVESTCDLVNILFLNRERDFPSVHFTFIWKHRLNFTEPKNVVRYTNRLLTLTNKEIADQIV